MPRPVDAAGDAGPRDLRITKLSTRSCPQCATPLRVVTVTPVRGLTLDQCERCGGVWFDHQEWDQLEAFRDWQRYQRAVATDTTWSQWWFQLLLQMPIEFNVPPHRRPIVTQTLIAVCVVVFAAELADTSVLTILAIHPAEAWSFLGAANLVTYEFVHASPAHLIGNMYFLYVAGDNVEDVMGPWMFLAFFVASGAIAALGQLALGPSFGGTLVGASGAISAVMAAYTVLFRMARLTVMVFFRQFSVPVVVWISAWVLLNLFGATAASHGTPSGVAFAAHLTGFAAGLLFTIAFHRRLVEGHPLLQLIHSGRLAVAPTKQG